MSGVDRGHVNTCIGTRRLCARTHTLAHHVYLCVCVRVCVCMCVCTLARSIVFYTTTTLFTRFFYINLIKTIKIVTDDCNTVTNFISTPFCKSAALRYQHHHLRRVASTNPRLHVRGKLKRNYWCPVKSQTYESHERAKGENIDVDAPLLLPPPG